MKVLRALSDYGWKHEWAFMPTQLVVWGTGLMLLPFWMMRRLPH